MKSRNEMEMLPIAPEEPVDPRIRDLAVDNAVFSQRAFVDEHELLQHIVRSSVARVRLGLNAVQVQCAETPFQQSPRRFGGEALAPGADIEAIAQLDAAIVRVPIK